MSDTIALKNNSIGVHASPTVPPNGERSSVDEAQSTHCETAQSPCTSFWIPFRHVYPTGQRRGHKLSVKSIKSAHLRPTPLSHHQCPFRIQTSPRLMKRRWELVRIWLSSCILLKTPLKAMWSYRSTSCSRCGLWFRVIHKSRRWNWSASSAAWHWPCGHHWAVPKLTASACSTTLLCAQTIFWLCHLSVTYTSVWGHPSSFPVLLCPCLLRCRSTALSLTGLMWICILCDFITYSTSKCLVMNPE